MPKRILKQSLLKNITFFATEYWVLGLVLGFRATSMVLGLVLSFGTTIIVALTDCQRRSGGPESDLKIQKPTLPKICRNSAMPDFVGPRSTILFKSIGVKHTFLASPGWRDQPEYQQVKAAARNLTPTNDCSERVLGFCYGIQRNND